ncbi:hypothetical protein MTR67_046792 [Solanum verrucosum]|uniref:Uncharacterized protein n=1 Tax=Solanum verrucosum TaxID=315347 RepID=A0AAF0UVG3_SOLVR|nr:hypothetical protein MTR67_046792 [Solanum verrucosum]
MKLQQDLNLKSMEEKKEIFMVIKVWMIVYQRVYDDRLLLVDT